jgi:hypothetical protein
MAHSMVGILVKRLEIWAYCSLAFCLILGGFECGLRPRTYLSAG